MRKYIDEHSNEFSDTNALPQERTESLKPDNLTEQAKEKEKNLAESATRASFISTLSQNLLDGLFDYINQISKFFTTIFSTLGALTISTTFTTSLYFLIIILIFSNIYTFYKLTPTKSINESQQPLIVETIRNAVNEALVNHHHVNSNENTQIEIDQLNSALDKIQSRLEFIKNSVS